MHVPGVTGVGHESYAGPEPVAEEPLVNRADRQQHWDRGPPLVCSSVRDDQQRRCRPPPSIPALRPSPHGARSLIAEVIEGAREPGGAGGGIPYRPEGDGLELGGVAQGGQLFVAQDRMLETDQRPPPLRGMRGEERAARPEVHPQRHDAGLPQRIDRGVRDLSESLAEVSVESLRNPGERGDRRVVPHTPNGVLARSDHRRNDVAEVLERVPERSLAGD